MTDSPPIDAEFETLIYEQRDRVAWVTLNRPEQLNAFDLTMQFELHELWRMLRASTDVGAIVLTGAGERAFCTGFDRKESKVGPEDPATFREQHGFVGSTKLHFNDPGDRLGPKSSDLWKPVIVAVNGIACGGAFYMLGEADFIIAADHATFFDPHLTMGRPATFEPVHMLPLMPFGDVMRMALMGGHERITAQTAREMGMVSEVVPMGELHESAQWCASRIAAAPPAAVEATVRALWAARTLGSRQAVELSYAFVGLGTTEELMAQSRDGQPDFATKARIEWRAR
jgi:enoyl-CoA hydratase/carnithine racemase